MSESSSDSEEVEVTLRKGSSDGSTRVVASDDESKSDSPDNDKMDVDEDNDGLSDVEKYAIAAVH